MRTSSLKAVIWDMDGVLVNSSHLHVEAWKYILAKHGIPYHPQVFTQIYGLKNSDFFLRLVSKPVDESYIKDIIEQKEDYFKELGRQLVALPFVVEWLKQFNQWGCKQAIASSGEQDNVEFIVEVCGIRKFFDALVTPGNLPGKPDPAVFIEASKQLGVPKTSCLVIEDSIPGIEAARRAGMHCVAVASTHPAPSLAQADIVIDSLEQLPGEKVFSIFN